MIRIGYDHLAKQDTVLSYCSQHSIRKVFVLSPSRFRTPYALPFWEHVEWSEIIMYRTFYRLLQEISHDSLIVIDECLRTQNRYDLTYNCIRRFLDQTRHQIIFQHLPLISDTQDFMVLFDFDTRSKWKRDKIENAPLRESDIQCTPVSLRLDQKSVDTPPELIEVYARKKRELICGIGLGDPDTIPRNLLLLAGKAKASYVETGRTYVCRNNRLKLGNLVTYREPAYAEKYSIFEFCHDYITFSDFLTLSGQQSFTALISDLKVDHWYLARFREWGDRLSYAYSAIQ